MLRVVNAPAAAGDHCCDGLGDHGKVLLERHVQHVRHVKVPRLAHDGDHRRLGAEKRLHPDVLCCADAAPASHAEGADGGASEVERTYLTEEGNVLLVRERETPLDVVESHVVEPLGDGQLVVEREADAFALRAIAEGGVVQLDPTRGSSRARTTAEAPTERRAKGTHSSAGHYNTHLPR